MFARTITLQGDPASMDDAIAFVRDEVMPLITSMEGCLGLSMIVDREAGTCISTSAWRSEEAMHASDSRLRGSRERARDIVQGEMQVHEWEMAVLHRVRSPGESGCVRVIWTRTEGTNADRLLDTFRMTAIPMMEELDGFCSTSLLLDRHMGRAVVSVAYDSREAMERARERAGEIRSRTMQQSGAEVTDIGEFELALSHLRVPEMV